ncbi:MAG: helix-turn-helix domain-containing protein [Alphaproteobacteria bacterium]|nr:helix-turn-helix domain-containing protein [Alphaproteobacteria bacterium]
MPTLVYADADASSLLRVKRIGPFAALRPEEFAPLVTRARLARAPVGARLTASGPEGRLLYVVLEGSICLFGSLPSGRRCLVEVVDAPCLIGESAMFVEHGAAIDAEVLRAALLVELPSPLVLDCLRANTAAQLRMLGYMSARLKPLIAQITDLKLMTGPQRLARFLVVLAERQSNPAALRLPFEKRTVAALLGMTPESLSRAFRRLVGLGVRTMIGGGIAIADLDRLRQFVEAESANLTGSPEQV